MKKAHWLLIFLLVGSLGGHAQVDPIYAQYLNNPFLINPAYTGMNKYLNVMAGFRKQWAGFDGSPTTLSATAHTSLINNRMGIGLIVSNDKIGENTNTLLQGTYAYKINISESQVISFGLQAGIVNYKNENAELNPDDPTDPLFSGSQHSTSPTFGAGVIYKTDNFIVGLSVPRMLNVKTDFESSSGITEAELYTQHFYGFTSMTFLLTPRLRFKPAVLIRGVSGSPLSYDVNLQLNVDERYGLGLLTRSFNTFGILAQMKFTQYRFGYVFEVPMNSSVGSNFTTHDLTFGINLSLFDFHDVLEVSDY